MNRLVFNPFALISLIIQHLLGFSLNLKDISK